MVKNNPKIPKILLFQRFLTFFQKLSKNVSTFPLCKFSKTPHQSAIKKNYSEKLTGRQQPVTCTIAKATKSAKVVNFIFKKFSYKTENIVIDRKTPESGI